MTSTSNAQALEYGDAITASISSLGEIDTYTFTGNTGDKVRIRMRGNSQGVDGCYQLTGPGGAILTEECDDGGIVQTTSFELPQSGTYSIIAKDHNDNDTGDYGLSLEILNRPDLATPVNCGDDLLTQLDNWTEVDLFSFECRAGDELLVQMRSVLSNVECRLELLDEAGNTLATETTQTGLASISGVILPADGRYQIAAYDGNGNDTGEYGISFQIVNQSSCAEVLECGATGNHSLDKIAEIDAYTITCAAGDQLQIRVADLAEDMEPNIALCDNNGNILASDIDNEDAEISYNIPVSGSYTLIVKDDKGNDTGTYSVALQVVNSNSCAQYLDCGNATFRTTLENENEIDVYSFKANAGEIINVQMRGYLNGIDPLLKVFDKNGNMLASDYINGAMASINDLVIPEEGLYTITAEDRNGNDTGDYGFSFQRVHLDLCPVQLGCDTEVLNGQIDIFSEMDVYEFDGLAGQLVTFVMAEVDVSLEPMIRFYAPDGTLINEEAKSFHVDMTDYVLPQDGRYVLVCLDKNGNDTGAYTISFGLNNEDNTSVCSTCGDGVQNGAETGIDCGGPDCNECCAVAGTACDDGNPLTFDDVEDGNCGCAGEICPTSNAECTSCPEDLVLYCSELSGSGNTSALPIPTSIEGAGSYDMTFRFNENIEAAGICDINTAVFDSGCIGIITACNQNQLRLTPDFVTCQGPLPELPFTITFNNELSVYFDENGNSSQVSNNSIAQNARIQDWLRADLNAVVCNVQGLVNDFDPSIFATVCDAANIGEEVSQVVNFEWIDLCNQTVSCSALITVINDNEPPCAAAGTSCDDLNPDTENDVEDGQCNCYGTIIPPAPSECDRLDLSSYNAVSYAGSADQGNITVIEDDKGYLLSNNAWKAIPFDYQITADTKLEFEFMSSQEGEIHGIGFDNNLRASSSLIFQLYGTQTYGLSDYRDYSEEGVYKKYIIPVGQFYTGFARYMTFIMDDDAYPRDANSLFRNIKVYEGVCADIEENIVGCGSGSISRDVFLNIPGYELSAVSWNGTADISDELTKFEAPIDVYDHYGTRIRGYICPPQSGMYTFWLASDDTGELWLSTDSDPANVQLIANVDGWTYPQVWDKYPTQQSVQIYLEAGQQYYIEAFQKEHEGLDNLAVGWQWPNGTMERPILGAHLSPYTGATTESVTDPNANINSGYAAPSTNSVNSIDAAAINIYPNPATDAVNVDVSTFAGQNISMMVTNSFGQPVYQQAYENLDELILGIDMSSPAILNGIYHVRVMAADGISVTQSFMILK